MSAFFNNNRSLSYLVLLSTLVIGSCKSSTSPSSTTSTSYAATYLVSDTAGFGASRIDAGLLNPWGIAVMSDGSFWIAVNHDSSGFNYNTSGQHVNATVSIPLPGGTTGASPSGAIINTTTNGDFKGAKVIYSTEDGILATWTSGASAEQVTTPIDSEEIKGLAIGNDGGANFIYATDFKENKIVVFNSNFTLTSKTLSDPSIPSSYGPFGISNIGGMLYVTYALHKPFPDNGDDSAVAGTGYVDVYTPNGQLVKRFASGGTFNSPWGIAVAGSGFGQFANAILIANFGDGRINAFDTTGKYLGQLMSGGTYSTPIQINGLWGITFNSITGDPNTLYFTAGPDEENHGTFGYVKGQ
ncbi:MAG TPA: TIGR03118 family protein [Candidatus Kapabacteria bacterium]|nr:TIGR03118 family protein [Candidatus Kapabacteria bacterium]